MINTINQKKENKSLMTQKSNHTYLEKVVFPYGYISDNCCLRQLILDTSERRFNKK